LSESQQKAAAQEQSVKAKLETIKQAKIAAQIKETELQKQVKASTDASIIAGRKTQQIRRDLPSQTARERILQGDPGQILLNTLKTRPAIITAQNKKYQILLNEQNTLKSSIISQLVDSAKQYSDIKANKDKYTKSSYNKFEREYNNYLSDVKDDLETIDSNEKLLSTATRENKALRDDILKTTSKLNEKKKRPPSIIPKYIEDEKVAFVGPPTKRQAEIKKYTQQKINLAKLVKAGVAKVDGDNIVLTVSPESLTKNLAKAAQLVGFDVAEKGGLSTGFYDWVSENAKTRTVQRAGEYGAVVIGQGEKVYANTIGRLSSWVSGKPQSTYRKVDIETLKQIKDLDAMDIGYLRVGTAGANFLANYAAFVPVGVATSTVLKGVASIPGIRGVGSKVAQTKILQEIVKRPKLVQALIYGPIVGVTASKIYSDYKSGKPEDEILYDISLTAGTLTGQAYGLVDGYKLSSKVEGWLATRGRSKIPPEELWTPEALKSQKYSTYKSSRKEDWSNEFKTKARELTADGYLGEVTPGEYRVWHGTPSAIKDSDYFAEGVWTVGQGDSTKHAGVGLFVAPEPSSYGLRLHKNLVGEGARLGLPGIKNTSEIATIDAFVEVMPNGLTQTQLKAWFMKQVGDTTVYIPPISTITGEMEALLPPGTQLGVIGQDWYTNFGGQRVLVNKYVLIPAGAIVPSGVKVVSFSSVASSTLPTSEAYLTMGLVPPTYQPLSTSQISVLTEQTGLSESDIRGLSTSIQGVSSAITRADLKTVELTSSDLKTVLRPVTTPTPTPTEPTTPTPTEPTTPTPTEPTTPTPTPPLPLTPKQRETRRKMTLQLFSGKNKLYRVNYQYKGGRKETIGPLEARSLPDALGKAQRVRSGNKTLPTVITVTFIGERKK